MTLAIAIIIGIAIYFAMCLILLKLNNYWDWIYDNAITDFFITDISHESVRLDNIKEDPGLTFSLVLFGPAVVLVSIVIAIAFCISFILFATMILFPRWFIGYLIRK